MGNIEADALQAQRLSRWCIVQDPALIVTAVIGVRSQPVRIDQDVIVQGFDQSKREIEAFAKK